MTGSEQAQHRLLSPTHAPAMAPGEHARVMRCKPREWHQRGEAGTNCSRAPHSSNACARNLRRGLRLRHCSLRSSVTQVHQQGIQCERTLCVRRGQVAEHGRTPALAARTLYAPGVLLVSNLRIGTASGCCCSSSSSLLLPHSVKPAAQRGVQNSRGLVPPEAERVQTR